MRCYLVRHAQTAWNFNGRIQGHSDQPLNAVGQAQALEVGRYFSGRTLTTIYTSHLARSRQTADAIAQQTGASLTVLPELAEIYLGEWEGLTPEEVNARFDGAYERWRDTPSDVAIPRAEPVPSFRDRVRRTAARILESQTAGEFVVVSHGGVIAAMLADWWEADYNRLIRRLALDNAGVSALDYRTRPPHVLWVNDTSHLAAVDGTRNGSASSVNA